MSVWFGFHLPSYTHPEIPPDRLFTGVVEQARAAEEADFSLVTVMDHLYQIPGVGAVTEPMLESWMTLAALARETSRVQAARPRPSPRLRALDRAPPGVWRGQL